METAEVLNNMKIPVFSAIFIMLDRLLGVERSEQRTTEVKRKASERVDEVSRTLDKQNREMKRTTTYYMAKAAGILK